MNANTFYLIISMITKIECSCSQVCAVNRSFRTSFDQEHFIVAKTRLLFL